MGWVLALATMKVQSAPLHFGMISDTPYTRWEEQHLGELIDEMNRAPLAFVLHGGDIKDSSSVCSDDIYAAVHATFQRSAHPLIYVPGDNEWVDCHHGKNAQFDPLERLMRLRRTFWSDAQSLGQRTISLQRQSADTRFAEFRENVRWIAGDVLFMGFNLPGSENNYWGTGYGKEEAQGPSAEFTRRGMANAAWLEEGFALARQHGLKGVALLIHGNPGFESDARRQPALGYKAFLAQLREEILRFSKPVVLMHGDTHNQHIDQPLVDPATGRVIGNFTRIEGFGSPDFGWVRGTIDPDDPVVFRFEAMRWAGKLAPASRD